MQKKQCKNTVSDPGSRSNFTISFFLTQCGINEYPNRCFFLCLVEILELKDHETGLRLRAFTIELLNLYLYMVLFALYHPE